MSFNRSKCGLVPEIVEQAGAFSALRRDLHAHPELSYEEHRTSRLVLERLRSWGIEAHQGLAGTGVVGVLRAGESSRRIGLRADMDALPVTEANQFAHASTQPGKMHACGHDGHTVMLLAAAKHLAETKAFDGQVVFIFQPAEERGAGAQRMIQEGLFEKYPCDVVFGIHNWPGVPANSFAVRPGPMMAGTAGFEITVCGRSSHAAMPHLGVDTILVACQIASSLQLLVSRELNPVETAVVSITQIHGGDTMNAIPDKVGLKGTVRAFSDQVFAQIESGMRRMAGQISAAFDASVEIRFTRNYPPTINDEVQTEFAVRVMKQVCGDDAVRVDAPLTMAAEDFAYMLQTKPGCYALLGNGSGDHREPDHGGGPCMLHNSSYDFNDDLIATGASYWVRLVEAYLVPVPASRATHAAPEQVALEQ